MSLDPYTYHHSVHNFLFHPLHKKETKKWAIVAHIALTIFTGFIVWQSIFWVVNRLDNRKRVKWKNSMNPIHEGHTDKKIQEVINSTIRHSPEETKLSFTDDDSQQPTTQNKLIDAIKKCQTDNTEKLSEVLIREGLSTNINNIDLRGINLSNLGSVLKRFFHVYFSSERGGKTWLERY